MKLRKTKVVGLNVFYVIENYGPHDDFYSNGKIFWGQTKTENVENLLMSHHNSKDLVSLSQKWYIDL